MRISCQIIFVNKHWPQSCLCPFKVISFYARLKMARGILSVCFVRPSVRHSLQSSFSSQLLLNPCMDLNET